VFIGLSLIYVFLNIVTSIFLRLLVGLFSRRHGRHVLISVSICVYFRLYLCLFPSLFVFISVSICVYFRLYVAFSGISPSPYQSLIFFMSHTQVKRMYTRKELRNLLVSQRKRGIFPSPYQSLIFFMSHTKSNVS